MFKSNDKKLNKMLRHIEREAGDKIRRFPKDVQEEALHEAIIAHLEGKDILEHIILWRRKERIYQKKVLSFTRGRPLKNDKEQIKRISKDYR